MSSVVILSHLVQLFFLTSNIEQIQFILSSCISNNEIRLKHLVWLTLVPAIRLGSFVTERHIAMITALFVVHVLVFYKDKHCLIGSPTLRNRNNVRTSAFVTFFNNIHTLDTEGNSTQRGVLG
jgi:hypothetical protein